MHTDHDGLAGNPDIEPYDSGVADLLSRYAARGSVIEDGYLRSWRAGESGVPSCAVVEPGAGTDVANAATAALAIAEELSADQVYAVPAVCGDRLLVFAPERVGLPGALEAVAARAPEIATLDPTATDGRALLRVIHDGASIPVPYSLVEEADVVGAPRHAVIPLTWDEIAAVTAGMPLELGPTDVPYRLRALGDLAAPLL